MTDKLTEQELRHLGSIAGSSRFGAEEGHDLIRLLREHADLTTKRIRPSPKERKYNARGMPLARVPPFPAHHCRDCGRHDDGYMVHDHVWAAAFRDGRDPGGCMCFDCLEHGLGRLLRIEDFRAETPSNRAILLGFDLGKGA